MKTIILLVCLIAVLITVSACSLTKDSDQPHETNVNEVDQETTNTDSTVTETENSNAVNSDTKTYVGNGFSFEYPKEWIKAENALWTQKQYDFHLQVKNNPPTGNYFDPAQIYIETYDGNDLGVFLNEYYTLEVSTYKDFTTKDENNPENAWFTEKNINGKTFIKADQDMLNGKQAYFIQNQNQVIKLASYYSLSEKEFEDILTTIKFNP